MQRHMAIWSWLISFSVGVSSVAFAQPDDKWAGKRVVVLKWSAPLRVGTNVVGQLRLGDVVSVDKANAPWLWVKELNGWLNESDVALEEQAMDQLASEIEQNATSEAYHRRGAVWISRNEYQKSIVDFDAAIARDPQNVAVYNDRGNAHRKLGNLDRALADFNELIRRNVRHQAVYTNRGLVLHDQRDYDRALADFNTAIGLDANFAPAWEAGGTARRAKGEYAKAIANFERAVQLSPDFHAALNNLAWLLATTADDKLRHGENAVKHASRACELTKFQDAGYLDTLAAALAESGKYEDAVKRANEALAIATEEHKPAIAERLKLYESSQPYRDKPRAGG